MFCPTGQTKILCLLGERDLVKTQQCSHQLASSKKTNQKHSSRVQKTLEAIQSLFWISETPDSHDIYPTMCICIEHCSPELNVIFWSNLDRDATASFISCSKRSLQFHLLPKCLKLNVITSCHLSETLSPSIPFCWAHLHHLNHPPRDPFWGGTRTIIIEHAGHRRCSN